MKKKITYMRDLKKKSEKMSVLMPLRLKPGEAREIKKIAKKKGLKTSTYLRELVMKDLEQFCEGAAI